MSFSRVVLLAFMLWLFPLIVPLFFPPPAGAQEAFIKDISISKSSPNLLVSFKVEGCFPDEIEKAIKNGVNTVFVFQIELNDVRKFWWNKEVAHTEVTHRVYYDNLKKIYSVTLEEKGEEPISVRNFGEVRELMSEIKDFKVEKLRRLHKGRDYEIRIKAEMDRIELPFNLDYVFFFLSLWDFETKWTSIHFKY